MIQMDMGAEFDRFKLDLAQLSAISAENSNLLDPFRLPDAIIE